MLIIFSTISRMVVETVPKLNIIRNPSTKSSFSYEDAIKALNTLQSNASVLQQSKNRAHNETCINLDETRKYMFRCGISMSKLNSLSVIHVAGTKGKGSTCAISESILRSNGFRTGFFSSPHLVSVNERIRLCGKPINKEDFVKYFETVYKALENAKEHSADMPPYFKFLTILAFKIFISEGVDVAIIEVGIGGEHDCTNVLRNVSTVGITSLGLEHTAILGNTIEQIAWQKAGIMKPGSRAFTVPQQYPGTMKVLEKRAQENNISLTVVPNYESYKFSQDPQLQIDTEAQKLNISLAIQLAHHWMSKFDSKNIIQQNNKENLDKTPPNENILLDIDEKFVYGLSNFSWQGRFQIFDKGALRFYLDGAHTIESLDTCTAWFKKNARSASRRALIFNATGDRVSEQLLSRLVCCDFDDVIFAPNAAYAIKDVKDQNNYMMPLDQQMERCYKHKATWLKLVMRGEVGYAQVLQQNGGVSSSDIVGASSDVFGITTSGVFGSSSGAFGGSVHVFDCIETSLEFLHRNNVCDVLITGSLHLVGSALLILDSSNHS